MNASADPPYPCGPAASPTAHCSTSDHLGSQISVPDSACNPYLALSVILAAGIAGIENNYELPAETGHDVLKMSAEERAEAGVRRLPANLADAVAAMEGSELARNALGEHVFEWFLKNKRAEWSRYEEHVSRFELEEYLPVL